MLDYTTEISTLETRQQTITVSNHPIHQHGHTNFWYVCLLERVYFNYYAAIMYCTYIINGVHGSQPRSPGDNTSSNPQISALIPRPDFNGIERMYQRHGSNQYSHPPVLVRKPLCRCHRVFLQQLIEAVWRPEYIDGPWWSMVVCHRIELICRNRYTKYICKYFTWSL